VDINIGDQKIFALDDPLGMERARIKAEELKGQAFGTLDKLRLFSRKDETNLRYIEKRYEPFWHLHYSTHIEYERQRNYALEVNPVVQSVVIDGREYVPRSGKLALQGLEHCVERLSAAVFVDAVTGDHRTFARHITSPRTGISETEELESDDIIVVPAKVKASSLTRKIVAEMLRPVTADHIAVEEIMIDTLHLYFRPVYAFEYVWPSKEKTATLELDAVTMDVRHGGVTLKQKMHEVFSEHDLFDLGADVVDLIVPGGGIAVKIARKVAKR
jgi:hypothetical protein